MKRNNQNTRKLIEELLVRHGYTRDRSGNYRKHALVGGQRAKLYRYKFSGISVRKELQIRQPGYKPGEWTVEWIRMRSGYLRDITIDTEKDVLVGMTRFGCNAKPGRKVV